MKTIRIRHSEILLEGNLTRNKVRVVVVVAAADVLQEVKGAVGRV